MSDFLKKNWKWILCFFIVFLVCLVLPFSGDDFEWGSKSISEFGSLLTNDELNGRYVGNFLVILITKNIFIRAFVTSLVLTGIVYLIQKETKAPSMIVWLLFILMPLPLIMQGITWASGFTNYTISTLLLLLVLMGLRKIFKDEASLRMIMGVSILVFLNSFFLENITLFLLILSIGLNIWYFIKKKKVNRALVVVTLMSGLGTLLMFIQPAYHRVFTGDDFYRSFAMSIKDIIIRAGGNYIYYIQEHAIFENVILLFVITGGLYSYYRKHEKGLSREERTILQVSFYYSLAYLIYATLFGLNSEWSLSSYRLQACLNGLVSGIYLMALLTQIIILFRKKKVIWKLLLPIVCIIGIMAPLLLVVPLGPRNFFVVYILEMIETFYILNKAEFDYKRLNGVAITVISVMLIYYVSIYIRIDYVQLQRDNYIKHIAEDTNANNAVVPLIPYNEFVHYDCFQDDLARPKYNAYKKIREDMTYTFIPYDDWVKKMEEEGYKITP